MKKFSEAAAYITLCESILGCICTILIVFKMSNHWYNFLLFSITLFITATLVEMAKQEFREVAEFERGIRLINAKPNVQ